jgi:hypothetical protein
MAFQSIYPPPRFQELISIEFSAAGPIHEVAVANNGALRHWPWNGWPEQFGSRDSDGCSWSRSKKWLN